MTSIQATLDVPLLVVNFTLVFYAVSNPSKPKSSRIVDYTG